jgi:hypothetical protein
MGRNPEIRENYYLVPLTELALDGWGVVPRTREVGAPKLHTVSLCEASHNGLDFTVY